MKAKLLLPILLFFFPFQIFAQRHYHLPRVKVKVVRPVDDNQRLNSPGISTANIPVAEISVDNENALFVNEEVKQVNLNESEEQINLSKKKNPVLSENKAKMEPKENKQPYASTGRVQPIKMNMKPNETKNMLLDAFTCPVFLISLVIGVLGVTFFILSATSAVSIALIQPMLVMGLALFGVGLAGVSLSLFLREVCFQ